MEILAFVITLAVGVLAEATIGLHFNMAGIGAIISVATMGAIIIRVIKNKK